MFVRVVSAVTCVSPADIGFSGKVGFVDADNKISCSDYHDRNDTICETLLIASKEPAQMRMDHVLRGLWVSYLLLGIVAHAAAQEGMSEIQDGVTQYGVMPVAMTQTDSAMSMAELQKLVEQQGARLEQLESSSKSKKKPVTQKWTGRIHYDYWAFPDESALVNYLETGDPLQQPSDAMGFRRLRLGLQGDIYDTMLYKIELDFAAPHKLAFKDAYFGWKDVPWLHTVLLGNQKRPYGLDALNSSRYNVFLERPFHVEAYAPDSRRVGFASYGLSDNQAWNWRWGGYLMNDIALVGSQRTDNYQAELAGRLANTIWYDEVSGGRGYAHWAVSGALSFPGGGPTGRFRTRPESRSDQRWLDTGTIAGLNRYQLIGLEGVVNVGALQIVSEYQYSNVERTAASDLGFGGYYVYAAYFLTGEHTPWVRKSGTIGRVKPFENFFLVDRCRGGVGHGWGAWQVAARYSYGDFSDQDILGGVGKSLTIGLNWWWTPHSRMQFNYIHGRIEDRDPATTGGNALPVGVATSGDYDIFGARFMVDF